MCVCLHSDAITYDPNTCTVTEFQGEILWSHHIPNDSRCKCGAIVNNNATVIPHALWPPAQSAPASLPIAKSIHVFSHLF